MIAVTGANGQLGQLVLKALQAKTPEETIVGLVRQQKNEEVVTSLGVEARHADYNQPATVRDALIGVTKLLLISSSEVGSRASQHKAVINAAKDSGVELLVYTSLLRADTSPMILAQEHKETEQMIKDSGIQAVILRNGWYTENYTQGAATAVATGAVVGAAGEGRLNTASRVDYAEAAAVVLTTQGHAGKTYELAGDEAYTLADFAAEIARQSGKPVQYQNQSKESYLEFLTTVAGLPQPFAEILADSDACAAEGALADSSKTLSKLIDRPATSLAESISASL
ncbi:SDR family oxidoreductase [Halioxenophilus aromaticivorans]|uniref:SDR family oxidoreductase n=1 Tax=Halioxenophilus aromaticivorans TaxID=1306992 RepID=A0AAV3U1T3_9ALTE